MIKSVTSVSEAMNYSRICLVMRPNQSSEFNQFLNCALLNFKKISFDQDTLGPIKADGKKSLMVYAYNDIDSIEYQSLNKLSEDGGGFLDILPITKLKRPLRGVKNDYEAVTQFINDKEYKFVFFFPAFVLFTDKEKDGAHLLSESTFYIQKSLVKNAYAIMRASNLIKKTKPILFLVVHDVKYMNIPKGTKKPKLVVANQIIQDLLK